MAQVKDRQAASLPDRGKELASRRVHPGGAAHGAGEPRRSPHDAPTAAPASPRQAESARRPSKKEQIVSLFNAGIEELTDIAAMVRARPSYVASVLQDAGLIPTGYHDLYTSTRRPINIYSKFFTGKLGFKDEDTAKKSVALIDQLYRQFAFAQDRAGQHHALAMALTMFDRARWTDKEREAEVFRRWLVDQLAGEAAG
jgi:hypothetical protein